MTEADSEQKAREEEISRLKQFVEEVFSARGNQRVNYRSHLNQLGSGISQALAEELYEVETTNRHQGTKTDKLSREFIAGVGQAENDVSSTLGIWGKYQWGDQDPKYECARVLATAYAAAINKEPDQFHGIGKPLTYVIRNPIIPNTTAAERHIANLKLMLYDEDLSKKYCDEKGNMSNDGYEQYSRELVTSPVTTAQEEQYSSGYKYGLALGVLEFKRRNMISTQQPIAEWAKHLR